jgi:hypothetical protein
MRTGKRFQRLICRACKYIWIEYSLPLPETTPVTATRTTSTRTASTNPAHGQDPARDEPSLANPSERNSPRLELPKVNPAQAEGQPVNSRRDQHSSQSATANSPLPTASVLPALNTMATVPFRRLELDVPTDWSPSGVLAYTQHAQHALQQALAQFEHPAMAELELQRLEPRVRAYVRARQAFDTALMLQWAAVYAGPSTYPSMPQAAHLDQPQIRPREATLGAREPSTSSLAGLDRHSNDDPDDPDDPEHSNLTALRQQLEVFKRQERTWRTDRLRLKQELELLELDKQRVVTNWTRVKQHYEGLKTRLRTGETIGQGSPLAALPAASDWTRQALPEPSVREAFKTTTVSHRIAPPALSPSARANIERLSNSLIANLLRLENYRIRPRDLADATGEKGPWKTVVEHLLNSGTIERVGDFITFSLVERLRRHLPAVTLQTAVNRRKA